MPNISKNAQGYGYKYTDLAAINEYIETTGETYYQEIEPIEGIDYVVTIRQKDGKEMFRIRGARVIQASLSGKVNAAQEQGSGLTYARRYSLLMAYGLATEDDDGEAFTKKPTSTKEIQTRSKDAIAEPFGEVEETPLDRTKRKINKSLEDIGYDAPVQKKAFIMKVLKKSTIDTIDEANEVMDAIENEQ